MTVGASYKVIVVGTDGSARATVAVKEALALAKMTGAKVHAVYVVYPAVKVSFVDGPRAQFESEVDAEHEMADRISAQLLAEAEREGVAVEMHTLGSADVANALISTARDVQADLVVVGNLGMSGVKRLVLGSVPNKVSHHCPCSLLIVNTDQG